MKIITNRITALNLFYIAILILFSSCKKNDNDNQSTVIKDVNVITMRNDSILNELSVLIKDSKIVDIGVFEEMDIPKTARIIDGKEQFLIPGLGDMHVHLSDVDDRFMYIANGVTLVRNMAGFPHHLKLRDDINKKHLTGPEIYTTGLLIEGLHPHWPDASIIITDKEKVLDVIAQMKNDGYDAVKIYEQLTKDVYDEIIRVAKEFDIPVVGHVPRSVDLKHALSSGQTSIEHLDGYGRYLTDELIITETVKSGIWNCPTLLIYKNYEYLDYLKENPTDETKYVYSATVDWWNTLYQINWGVANYMKLLNTLTNNNANIVAGTDAGVAYVVAGFSLHEELSLRQDAGLSPYQILLSATRNCAEMLGYESRLGTIERGKDADLVLLNNNPLEDINNTKSIVGVMTKGRWYPKEELNLILEKIADKKDSFNKKSTIHNNLFVKILVLILTLTFLSTFLIRPVLFVFNKNKLKLLIRDNVKIRKYRIRLIIVSVSIISLIILFIVTLLSEAEIQYGLPIMVEEVPEIMRYKIVLPFVNLLFMIPLFSIYMIGVIRRDFSTFRKWHTLSIISASVILIVLLNYWELINLNV